MSNQTDRKCKNCRCWDPSGNGTEGLCRAHAPKPITIKSTSEKFSIIQPTTTATDWCYHDFVPAKIEQTNIQ